jgi:hypothetical protein
LLNLKYSLNCGMTLQTLERAKEIQYTIDDLKKALSEISRGRLFSIETSPSCTGRQADPLLAEIENDLKAQAQSKVLAMIKNLSDEFESL